jgi:hypothetical protein
MIRRPSTPAQTGFRPQLLCALFGAAVAHAVAGATWADTPPAPPLPPPAAVEAIGAQAGLGEGIVVGRGSRLQPAATDGAVIGHLLDGVEVLPEVWSSGWSPGSHVAAVRVAGPDGAPLELPQLPFVYDPDPPTLEWEVGTTALLDTFGLDQDVERRKPPRHTLPERDKSVKVLWSPDGRRWIPLLPRKAEPNADGALAEWLVAADRPQVFLWVLGDGVFGPGTPVAPEKGQIVRVWSADALSAVRDMRLRVLPASGGTAGRSMEVVSTDLVGNETTFTWPLAR